jgi:hypothetical protein
MDGTMALLKDIENLGLTLKGFDPTEVKTITETIEVQNPVKRPPGRYPPKGWTPTIKKEVTRTIGGKPSKNVTWTGRPDAWVKFWHGMRDGSLALSDLNKGSREHLLRNDSERVRFTGGTSEDVSRYFRGEGDMELFYAAKDRIESTDWMQDIRRTLESAYPKRRRVYGDEGQWVEARRWDGDAFEDNPVVKVPCKQIEIVAISNAPCYCTAKDLAAYGASVWAIVDTLESFGVSVKFTQRFHSIDLFSGNEDGTFDVEMKEAGEYLSPTFIAGFMTPNFWRRVVWLAFTASADISGKVVGAHYGRSVSRDAVSYSNGVLTLTHTFGEDASRLLPALLEFIEAGKDIAA